MPKDPPKLAQRWNNQSSLQLNTNRGGGDDDEGRYGLAVVMVLVMEVVMVVVDIVLVLVETALVMVLNVDGIST